jgi:hypothetical protein
MIHYSTPSENPNTSETTRTMLRSSQTTKRRYQRRKKHFLLQIPTKGHKVPDLTRPNELSTTTSKAATKSTDRTRLWKRPRAPSYNTTEDNQLRYTVVFKGRTQYIQDGYQQHSGTIRTRQGSHISVYPSPM